ncbi:MAG: hypothetical protein ACXV2E_07175 [Halobacteriota archaeon]
MAHTEGVNRERSVNPRSATRGVRRRRIRYGRRVVTKTAIVHATARLFDDYTGERSRSTGEHWRSFDAEIDYRQDIDGKPRYDGVRSFLAPRGIVRPEGTPVDPDDAATVCGLGNQKNSYFLEELAQDGAGSALAWRTGNWCF